MLGNFFNNMYYGKAGKGDFRPEDLPTNRWQLFFEMLRIRWGSIVKVNLLYLLIWIPAIAWSYLNIATLFALSEAMANPEATEGVLALAEGVTLGEQFYSLLFSYLLGMIPCIAITGPFTAGITLIMRNWARDQHVFIMSDFKDALRSNWKQALGISAITGLVPFVVLICWRFYGIQAQSSVLFLIPQVFTLIIGVIWMLSLNIIYSLMITYSLKFGQLLRNSLILTVGRLPQTLGIRLVTLVLPILVVLSIVFTTISGYVMLFAALFYLVIGLGLNRFIYASYANALCDQYINPRIEGAPLNLGLRQETDDDYEIDPTMPQPPSVKQKAHNEEP